MKKYAICLLSIVLLSSSCKKVPLTMSEVIAFDNKDPLAGSADNITTVSLTVMVPKDSDPQTQVAFTTDLGTFVNSNGNTITIGIDGSYKATVQLKSGTTGTATVKAMVATSYSAFTTVNFSSPDADKIFTVAPFTDKVAADGVTTMVLTAIVNKSLPASAQSVTFTADNNATFSNNTGSMSITADNAGNAIAYLKKAAEGVVHVTMTDLGVTRNITVNFIAPNADDIFTIAPFTNDVMADGVSTMVLTAAVNKALPVAAQLVTFAADNGATFSNGNPSMPVAADAVGNAVAYLKKSVEGPVHVTMTSGGATRNLAVNFIRSVPDYMLLSNAPSLKAGIANFLPITITLVKNTGKPAAGYVFTYQQTDANGDSMGVFSNGTASDSNGTATVNFTAGNSNYQGLVTIKISVQQFPSISQTATVLVNN